MAVETQALLNALQAVTDPNTGKDFVSTKALKNLQVSGGEVSFDVELGYPAKSQIPALRSALVGHLQASLQLAGDVSMALPNRNARKKIVEVLDDAGFPVV